MTASGQDFQTAQSITFGPVLGGIVSMSTSSYHVDNTVNSGRLAFSIGGVTDIPLGQATSLATAVQYYHLAFYDKNTQIDNPSQNLSQMMITRGNFGYIGFSALLNLHNVLAGAQVGIPVRAHLENCRAEPPLVPLKEPALALADVNYLVELKLGYQLRYALIHDQPLVVQFIASYPLNEMLRASATTRPRLDENFHIPSLALNLSLPFAL